MMASDPTSIFLQEEEPIQSSNNNMSGSTISVQDIDAIINTNKATIRDILSNNKTVVDSSLLQGALSFCHSKFTAYILDTLTSEYKDSTYTANSANLSATPLHFNQNNASSSSVGNLVDRVWIEIHHPAIKYFQSSFYQLNKNLKDNNNNGNGRQYNSKASKYNGSNNNNNNSQSFVEYRKLFDRFVKFIAKAYDFYFYILKTILNTYDLSIYIPVKKLCSTLKISLNSVSATKDTRLPLPDSNHLVSSIIYLTHKCVLFIGDLSRYRTLIAKTYLPSTSISKEDNNNYSKSIELYKLSLLILPSLGDPYNHIAIIDNLKDDKFNVVYNFIRASLTSSPLTISYSNLLNLLSKHPRTNSILRKFEHLNSLDRSSITKNDRLGLLKSQFLILLNYNLLPNKWRLKPGYLISGHSITSIENDFYYLLSTLDFHKQIFNDFYFKQLVILTGGFELLIDSNNLDDSKLSHSSEIISDYLVFLFRYMETFLKICIFICDDNKKEITELNNNDKDDASQNFSMSFSTSLLPVIRLLLCWFKEREIARVYLKNSTNVASLLAILMNRLISYFDRKKIELVKKSLSVDNTNEKNALDSFILSEKPTRQRLFKEDVALREFKPVNYLLTDFNDSHLYRKDPGSVLALIGELPESSSQIDVKDKDKKEKNNLIGASTKINDNLLRLVSIVVLGKKLILENTDDIKWIDEVNIDINDDDEIIDTNDDTFDGLKLLGSFMIPAEIDIEIHEPSVSKANIDLNNTFNNTSSNGVINKSKEPTHKQLRKKRNDNSRSNSTNNNFNSYAGSSFSTFGSNAPPSESFDKFDKFKRNKAKSNRAQSNSNIMLTSSSTGNGSNNLEVQLQPRPQTSPEFNNVKDYQQTPSSHSQYIDMVASIVNEGHGKNKNKNGKDIQTNKTGNDGMNRNSSDDSKSIGNIGITKDMSSVSKPGKTGFIEGNNNDTVRKGENDVSASLQNDYESGYMSYFNQWNGKDSNNRNNNRDELNNEKSIDLINQMNLMNQINMNPFQYNNQMNQFNQMNRFNSMVDDLNSVSLNNGFDVNLINSMNIMNNMGNMSGINSMNMSINNMNGMNMNNINMNNLGSVNLDMNMNLMNSMNNIGNMNMNNIGMSMNNMNMNNMNNINNINNINTMNNLTNINNLSNMSNLNNFNNLNALNSLNGNLMGLDNNNMTISNIAGLSNNIDVSNVNSKSVFNDGTENDESVNGSGKNEN